MNNQLIEKIITSNNLPCPEFSYDNPVLDRNVAQALSKSFVKILNLSNQNSKVNSNLRLSVLENIRKMCQIEPENHIKFDEKFTNVLMEFYQDIVKDSRTGDFSSTDKSLDAFLIRNSKEMNISSSQKSSSDPEVVQALINLNLNQVYLEEMLKDVIHWDCTQIKNVSLLKHLWTNSTNIGPNNLEDLPVKLKSEIEKILLQTCHHVLNETKPNDDEIFHSDISLHNVVKISSDSANCFQICCRILNYLFITTNFNLKLQNFISTFVINVKKNCLKSFSGFYPAHISHIAMLLDMDLESLPASIKDSYLQSAIKYLSELHHESENDLIMLLSHFPQWFDIFFTQYSQEY